MQSFNEWLLNEVFDSNVNFTQTAKGANYVEYSFDIDGRTFKAEFVDKYKKNDYELIFSDETGGIELSGKGDAFKVFAAVFNIIKRFLKDYNPDVIRFSGKKDERSDLYDKLAVKLKDIFKLDLKTNISDKEKIYILIKNPTV